MPSVKEDPKTPIRTPKVKAEVNVSASSAHVDTPALPMALRRTRRTSALTDTPVDVDSPRLTRSTRKSVPAVVETPQKRQTRRTSLEPESIPTPSRIMTRRRSGSVQSEDVPVVSSKTPGQPTIQEEGEAPVTRRTRRSNSVASEDKGPTMTPKKLLRNEIPSTIEEEGSPSRPITRSLSKSPAIDSPKKSPRQSPVVTSLEKTPKPGVEKTPDRNGSRVETPKSTSSSEKSSKSPSEKLDKSLTRLAVQVQENIDDSGDEESLLKTPKPRKKDVFSKSWSQAVTGLAKNFIDGFGMKKSLNKSANEVDATSKTPKLSPRVKTPVKVDESSSSDDDEEEKNEMLDDKAEEVRNYESGDSMDEEEKRALEEERERIEASGIELGSEDTEGAEDSDDDEDDDSFIESDEETALLSYSDEDEGAGDDLDKSRVSKKKNKRVLKIVDSSCEEDEADKTPESSSRPTLSPSSAAKSPVSATKSPLTSKTPNSAIKNQEVASKSPNRLEVAKAEPKPLPKVKLHQKLSTGDPDISISPMEITIFNPDLTKNSVEPMDVDEEPLNSTLSITSSGLTLKELSAENSRRSSLGKITEQEEEPIASRMSVSFIKKIDVSAINKTQVEEETTDSDEEEPQTSRKSVSFIKKIDVSGINKTKMEGETSDSDFSITESESESDKEADENGGNEEELEEKLPKKKKKETVSELGQRMREERYNQLGLVKAPENLQAIVDRCEQVLAQVKEERTKKQKLHKKEKELKKKAKASVAENELKEEEDEETSTLKKKKKKQRIGRKYNGELGELEESVLSEGIKKRLEALEKKRQRNREKKQAKLAKLKEANGGELPAKPKAKEAPEKPKATEKVVQKKPKSLLTAFEAKQLIFGEPKSETKQEPKSATKSKVIVKPDTPVVSKQPTVSVSAKKSASKEVISTNRKPEVEEPSSPENNKENRMLKILSNGFAEIPVTPEAKKLKQNRGFKEEPTTPRPIGFKVSQVMPTEEPQFVQKKREKRKRPNERGFREPSKVPPKSIWSSSGKFEEEDTSFIALSTNTSTEFNVFALDRPAKRRAIDTSDQGLSSFKHQALFEARAGSRQPSKNILRQREKQKATHKRQNRF